MLRTGASLLALIFIVPPVMADRASETGNAWQVDTYRSAGTYRTLRGSTPEACAATCLEDGQCRAWSLKPPTFRAGPKCELKSLEGAAIERTASVSGVVRPEENEAPRPPIETPKVAAEPQVPEPEPRPAPPAPARSAPTRGPAVATPGMPAPSTAPAPKPAVDPAPATPVRPKVPRQAAAPVRAFPAESAYEVVPQSQLRPVPAPQQQPAPAAAPVDPDRPWPGLRRNGETRALPAQTGGKPLPRLRRDKPDYSIEEFNTLPGDFEDNAGLQGRLPIGHTDDVPEEGSEKDESAED